MKQDISLDDCAFFLAVAEAGGLAGAARATGASVPTLSRRMAVLETRTGQRLFLRGSHGYTLTSAGAALRSEVQGLGGIAERLRAFTQNAPKSRVRITAGFLTSEFLARHVESFWSPSLEWLPEFVPTGQRLDIARRSVDIGIRNQRPDQEWLAGQRTSRVRYAPFARHAHVTGWVALPVSGDLPATQRWIRENEADKIVTTANDSRLARDLAVAGVGQVLLPLFAADGFDLVQSGPVIDALTHEEWLVSHHAARDDPPIRSALDRISALLRDRRKRPV